MQHVFFADRGGQVPYGSLDQVDNGRRGRECRHAKRVESKAREAIKYNPITMGGRGLHVLSSFLPQFRLFSS